MTLVVASLSDGYGESAPFPNDCPNRAGFHRAVGEFIADVLGQLSVDADADPFAALAEGE